MKKTTPKHTERIASKKRSTNNIKSIRPNQSTEWQLAVAGCQLSWKKRLTYELLNLEENLDLLYQVIGVSSNTILGREKNDNHDDDLRTHGKLGESEQDYETTINDYLFQISSSAQNICILLGVRTEFDLPIPVLVLLRMAAKMSLIRWKDYKKRPNGLLKNHVYSLTPYLINISLTMFQTLVTILGTNIIPFMPFLNQTVLRTLEWTRTSNLVRYDESLFHSLRLQMFKVISFLVERLSLNINLEPQFLKSVLEIELVDNLRKLMAQPSDYPSLKNRHIVEALICFENLMIVYSDFLDEPLEKHVKNFAIQTCVMIYRDFESNTISTACRRQLLHLLQIIANQPQATSITEISYHIFELVEKVESDPEMKSVARKALKIGLAFRPTIVTHYDVYNSYSRTQLVIDDDDDDDERREEQSLDIQADDSGNGLVEDGGGQQQGEQLQIESMQYEQLAASSNELMEEQHIEDSGQQQHVNGAIEEKRVDGDGRIEDEKPIDESQTKVEKRVDFPVQLAKEATVLENIEEKDECITIQEEDDDIEILPYMNHFVDKLA